MKLNRLSGLSVALLLCVFNTACFTFEQEVFLNPDGTGEFVLYISLPDLPHEVMSQGGGTGAKKGPTQDLDQFKKEVLSGVPPSLKVKEVKELRQNGVRGIIAILQFKDLKDVTSALANLSKSALKEGEIKGNSEWAVQLEKTGSTNNFTARILFDIADKKTEAAKREEAAKKEPPVKKPEGKEGEATVELKMDGFEEQMQTLLLGMIRMRFVLHTPTPIKETNADVVLQEKTAIWNCSLAAFTKNKKPIEMKASY